MTTEIKKRITGKQMTTAFFDNDKNDNIRNYRAINFDENNTSLEKEYTYLIEIRHKKNEYPKKIFQNILNLAKNETL